MAHYPAEFELNPQTHSYTVYFPDLYYETQIFNSDVEASLKLAKECLSLYLHELRESKIDVPEPFSNDVPSIYPINGKKRFYTLIGEDAAFAKKLFSSQEEID